ncbi:MAG: cupredoxin domain-containing protein [Bdellovibrionales bacterium]|nr:cupredoxin domain-containing protein [Bdellovibrionales bacterium]
MKLLIMSALLAISFQSALAAQPAAKKQQIIKLEVTEKGFEPSSPHAKSNVPVTLQITRKTDATCATAISIPAKKLKVDLPLNQMVEIKLGKLKNGTLHFACGMNMMDSAILVD